MTFVGASFIDLGRTAAALDGIGAEATHTLKSGWHGNMPRYLKGEAWTIDHVLSAVRSSPDAFTGATDVDGAITLLESAKARIAQAKVAVEAAPKVGFLHRKRDASAAVELLTSVGNADVTAAMAADAKVGTSAADDVRKAHALLGGTRALPELEQLAADAPDIAPGLKVAAADDPAVKATGHKVLQKGLRGLLKGGLGAALGYHGVNASTVPHDGAVLVAPTHGSMRDPFHSMRFIDRPMRAMAVDKFASHPVLGPVLRAFGAYPVSHGNAAEGMATARGVLATGQASLIYPEAMLVRGDWVSAHRNGAAELALEMRAKIVPTASYGAKPHVLRGEGFGRPLMSYVFGDVIDVGRAANTDTNVEILRERVARAQHDLLQRAEADYDARRAVALAHRPYFATGVGLAGAGVAGLEYRHHTGGRDD